MKVIRDLHRAPEPDPKVMSFFEHLEELRTRLIIMVAAVVIGAIAGWFIEPWAFQQLVDPLDKALQAHHNTIPGATYSKIYSVFTLKLKLSILIGIVLSMPILVFQGWGFIVPALPARFYRLGPFVMISAIVLFLAGAITGFEVMPLAINFFIGQASSSTTFVADAPSYVSFVSLIIVVFGVSFELPLVLVLLSVVGITNSGWLWRKRVIAFFIIFAASAIITPGADWISPLVLGAILYVLYLVSIVVAKLLGH
jgi:sec-independent protein translocase protein TatC